MEKELFDMKHEMISMQRELQEAKDAVKKLEQEKESEEHRANSLGDRVRAAAERDC